MAFLVIHEFVVFFLEELVAAITEVIFHDAKKVQFSLEAACAFVLREVQFSLAIKLDYVGKEVRIAIKEIFVPFLVEEEISPRAS